MSSKPTITWCLNDALNPTLVGPWLALQRKYELRNVTLAVAIPLLALLAIPLTLEFGFMALLASSLVGAGVTIASFVLTARSVEKSGLASHRFYFTAPYDYSPSSLPKDLQARWHELRGYYQALPGDLQYVHWERMRDVQVKLRTLAEGSPRQEDRDDFMAVHTFFYQLAAGVDTHR